MHNSSNSAGGSYRPLSPSTPWLHSCGSVNGIRLHWVEAGPRDAAAQTVLLLHGFPEFWYSWRSQIVALSAAGYRVVAPDLRGYNLSDKPATGYDLNSLSDDVLQLIEFLSVAENKKVTLVGHDWGGVIAWATAARFPGIVNKLVILNAPHLTKMANAADRQQQSLKQRLAFWYVTFFQIPCFPELILSYNRAWLLARALKRSTTNNNNGADSSSTSTTAAATANNNSSIFDDATIELYRDAMSQPGAVKCMLSYYRNWAVSTEQSRCYDKIACPVLILWGNQDAVLQTELIRGIDAYCAASLDIVYLECGHWTQQELPDEVNRHLILFLGKQQQQERAER